MCVCVCVCVCGRVGVWVWVWVGGWVGVCGCGWVGLYGVWHTLLSLFRTTCILKMQIRFLQYEPFARLINYALESSITSSFLSIIFRVRA